MKLKFVLFPVMSSLFCAGNLPAKQKQEHTRPNIIFIVTDDLGKGDLSCYGNSIIKTPNIDRIGQNGLQLDQYRAAAPISGPSRVSLLTGRYPDRSGYRMTHVEKTSSLDEPWLACQLRDNGYSTAAIGKWHLGDLNFKDRGFNHWVITSPGGYSDYYKYKIYQSDLARSESEGVYATDFLTNEAIKFIEKEQKPFFLYLAYTAPHFPLQVPEKYIEPFRNIGLASGTEILYGMIANLDENIGRLTDMLEKTGKHHNTLIVFTSDNGPIFDRYQGLSQERWNCGLAKSKQYVYEGGINVPCLVQWPVSIKPVQGVLKGSMHAADWAPTILAAAEITPKGKSFDGVNYLPALQGKAKMPEVIRMWCYNKAYLTDKSNAAVIHGDWKLVRPFIRELNLWNNKGNVPENIDPLPWQLFNLKTDPGEKNDLSQSEGARVKSMSEQFNLWWEEILNQNMTVSGPVNE